MSNEYVFEMKDITKAFGRNIVLDGVSISVRPGEIRALMGENGAGKSTLMKILGGIYSADSGTIYMDGKEVSIRCVDDARKYGISFIHQEITNIPEMTIAENIFLGREPKNHLRMVDYKKMRQEAQKALNALNLNLDAGALIRGLSVAQQQMIEIARAVNEGARILILDEPTASLSNSETDYLFAQMARLKQLGVAMIYISHRMEETFKVCDTVTVLRDGQFIGTRNTNETSENELISMMVGREFDNMYGNERVTGGDVVLEVKNLTTDKVKDISFTLKKGEILGFSGLVGAGRTELALALFGIDPIKSGEVWMEGKKLSIRKPQDAIRAGIALVPEERKEQGLFLIHSIATNLTFQVLPEFINHLSVNKKRENEIVDEFKNKLSIKMASTEQAAGELSGGNQQKVVISKWLAARPKVLIMDEPTRGIDVGAKAEIYKLMHNLAREGVSIIMISSELPEIINNSSRIAVMREGKLAGILDQSEAEASQEVIMSYAVGGGR
ncbi:MAG TPA: sugar ABC transporter ATP-binding protein [Candidatus Enterocloster excrementigallinarum]|uniref:Sugar ABC transporter ATP-binding protein n=1 Tax=Candidatus Enterocloster excrementigallinarum TaxID=2838558 RepID=A0A9D2TG33_9FIRM|nr:sugar ABC transporter ATP-binding protein [Candidatus Enterocloster excrementigallinarum]